MSDIKKIPCIFIPGFGQSKAYEILPDGSKKKVWPLNIDVKAAAKRIFPPYLKTVLARKDSGFTDTAYDMFCEVFEPFRADEKGESVHNIDATGSDLPLSEYTENARGFVHKIAPVKYLSQHIGEENLFCFSYNAFDCPCDTAAVLDAFIRGVKKRTQSEKVNLICYSMGGSVAAAYLSEYGEKNDVAKILFISACLGGSAIQKSIISRDIDKNMGYSLLGFISGDKAVKTFKRVLSLTVWDVRYALLYRSLDAVQDTLLTTSPGMWAQLPVETSKEYEQKLIADEKYARLKEKVLKIRTVNENIPQILKDTQNSGTDIYIAAAYGSRIMPLCADGKINTDGILAVTSSAPGVTAADLGDKLKNGQRLSPDGQLDAENCLFPDRTWFFPQFVHGNIARSDELSRLADGILYDGRITDVYSDESLPQFSKT